MQRLQKDILPKIESQIAELAKQDEPNEATRAISKQLKVRSPTLPIMLLLGRQSRPCFLSRVASVCFAHAQFHGHEKHTRLGGFDQPPTLPCHCSVMNWCC